MDRHIEYDNLDDKERHDLVTGDMRPSIDQEVKNLTNGFIIAGLGLLMLFVAGFMTWFPIWSDQGGSLLLSHAIMLTLAFLFICFSFTWIAGSQKALKNGKPVNSTLTLVVF